MGARYNLIQGSQSTELFDALKKRRRVPEGEPPLRVIFVHDQKTKIWAIITGISETPASDSNSAEAWIITGLASIVKNDHFPSSEEEELEEFIAEYRTDTQKGWLVFTG